MAVPPTALGRRARARRRVSHTCGFLAGHTTRWCGVEVVVLAPAGGWSVDDGLSRVTAATAAKLAAAAQLIT